MSILTYRLEFNNCKKELEESNYKSDLHIIKLDYLIETILSEISKTENEIKLAERILNDNEDFYHDSEMIISNGNRLIRSYKYLIRRCNKLKKNHEKSTGN